LHIQGASEGIFLYIQMFQEESVTLRNVSYVTLHLYLKMNGYGDNDARNRGLLFGSTYCTCLAQCAIRPLRSSVLELTAKASHAEVSVIRRALGNLGFIVMKVVRN